MFDPFKDFEEAGYLQNRFKEKNLEIVREIEHTMFRAGLDDALSYLSNKQQITYSDFKAVHKILFHEFYPWAGKDRNEVVPNLAISKANTQFCHPVDIERAVAEGLKIAHDKIQMRKRSGEVMGYFAYGHPFLDGNGRTMLIIHSELCYRAGFCIDWQQTAKNDYLSALSKEITSPGKNHLDSYLSTFIVPQRDRLAWGGSIGDIKGLDGSQAQDSVEGEYSNQEVLAKYKEFELNRNK
ncbi:Fic family protein [Alkalimonas collagenimarina]|uniref:protein adenylyltransferase n=1 Tax=Alkalimonas collagenimarina TaxID=400390 RepID=A0ABT9H072_9GAMM|nr:Fic family protein [Alkalimonas collagenimarina]MDP4536335.1 Fic family protein [Alkalimonas collagenimarina]